jgi:hypothetical protein
MSFVFNYIQRLQCPDHLKGLQVVDERDKVLLLNEATYRAFLASTMKNERSASRPGRLSSEE